MLTYVSIYVGGFGESAIFPAGSKGTGQFYFESKQNLFFVQRSEDTINLIEFFYSHSFKKQPNFSNNRIVFEQKFTSKIFHYIQFSLGLWLSTEIWDLIYPFDYFW